MKQQFHNEINLTFVKEGKDIEEERENVLVTITTPDNQQKNIFNENKTSFNLGKCEEKLKKYYNITDNNSSLYIFKVDVNIEGMKIPIILYEIYYPLYNNSNITQLNLSICKNSDIDLYIPVILNDTKDKYNSSSDYYNNICSKANTENGVYIPLNDRKEEFIENNMTLCEENCKFVEYNYINKKAKCTCEIKLNFPLINEIKFDKDKLYESFTDIKNIANLNLMKCYKSVFKKECIIKNYGFYILSLIIILFFISFIIFICNYHKFKNKIHDIFLAKNEENKIIKTSSNNKKENIKKNKRGNMKMRGNNLSTNNKLKINGKTKNKNIFSLDKNKKMKKNNLNNINNNLNSSGKIQIRNNSNNIKETTKSKKIISSSINIGKKYNKHKKILEYDDTEINTLEYKQALKDDKRTFSQYYISLLKLGHLLIFSFYNNRDYNSRIIKIFLFFFFFTVHFTINALFFNDTTMHKIFIDEGSYNFIYQIPQILYSLLISGVINALIKFLSLSENEVIAFKKDKAKNLVAKYIKLKKSLKIKFGLFFILCFLLLIVFWYYITCFCCIYENTQIHLIKDSVVSFGMSFIYPFGIYLLPAIIRINALKDKKKNKECLYKLSLILQMI